MTSVPLGIRREVRNRPGSANVARDGKDGPDLCLHSVSRSSAPPWIP
jgi:hypothetical protein